MSNNSLAVNPSIVNTQTGDSQLAASRHWVARAEQLFPLRGIDVTVSDIRVTLTAHCAKCRVAITEAFDMDADGDRTKYALIVFRDKLTPHSVPLLCIACRPRPSLLTLMPKSIQARSAGNGGNGGGSGRKGKPKSRQYKGQRRMTFSMAVEIAGGYGYLLKRAPGGYAIKPRTGGEWVGYATLNDALAAIETATAAARKAR